VTRQTEMTIDTLLPNNHWPTRQDYVVQKCKQAVLGPDNSVTGKGGIAPKPRRWLPGCSTMEAQVCLSPLRDPCGQGDRLHANCEMLASGDGYSSDSSIMIISHEIFET
jgi:hypothetical protein